MEGPYVQLAVPPQAGKGSRSPIAFLDRDGVINRGKPGYVNGPDEVVLLEGAATVIGDLNRAGYLVCVVTNQSPLARSLWKSDTLEAIHEELQRQLHELDPMADINVFLTCPHRFEDHCSCRKPSPGMLLGHQILRQTEGWLISNRRFILFHGQRWTGGARLPWGIIPWTSWSATDARTWVPVGRSVRGSYRVHATVRTPGHRYSVDGRTRSWRRIPVLG